MTPSRATRLSLATLGTSVAAAALLASPAAAAPAHARPHVRPAPAVNAQALRNVDAQLAQLSFAKRVVTFDRAAAADEAALSATLQSDITALTALRTAIKADTTADAVATHVSTLTGYHVPDFVLPRVSVVVGSDDLTALAGKLTTDETRFSTAIASAQTAGKDVTTASALLADYTAKVDAGKVSAGQAHDAALALDVAGAPGNAASLKAAQSTERSAISSLSTALNDARKLHSALHLR